MRLRTIAAGLAVLVSACTKEAEKICRPATAEEAAEAIALFKIEYDRADLGKSNGLRFAQATELLTIATCGDFFDYNYGRHQFGSTGGGSEEYIIDRRTGQFPQPDSGYKKWIYPSYQ
jgi:hypothetical protein